MSISESSIKRAKDAFGDEIKTYLDGIDHVQAVGLADEDGDQTGTHANPLAVTLDEATTLELILKEVRFIGTGMAMILGQRGEEE